MSQSARNQIESAAESAGTTESRAKALVNPTSGIANDYLNIFNELVMLVELLPDAPEFAEDIFGWRPRSYQDYFTNSNLPGSQSALEAYAKLDMQFRKDFETIVHDLERIATGSVVALRRLIKKGDAEREALAAQCAKTCAAMHELILKASNLIDNGYSKAEDDAQRRADRLLEVRIHALKEVEAFHGRPRFAQG